jgi:hypothetical protein
MIEVLRNGLIGSDDHLSSLIQTHAQLVIPTDDDVELTHWWVIRADGVETLYLGNVETFDTYVIERNGGLQ